MWKTVLTTIFLLLVLNSPAQRKSRERKSSETWWTIYGETQILPGSVYITAKRPAIGYGSGHTLVFISENKSPKRTWFGWDFNHHYFGRKQINDFKVFYESWQLSFVTRISFPSGRQITPYIDLSGGLRLLISFTANDRTYAGLLIRRWIDIIDATDGYDAGLTDHKVIREYDRFMPTAGIAAGFWLSNKAKTKGLSIKASANIGTASKFADYRELKTESDAYNYIITRGSGAFFNIQIGYSLRN
jgi:hypothetical protein